MFMFNLLFDFTNPNGLFSDRTDPNPLLNSKHWLLLPAAVPNPGFDPEDPASWPAQNRLGKAGPLHIPGGPNHAIALRIAPDPSSVIDPGATGVLVVSFGRPVSALHPFASPFVVAGQTMTTYQVPLQARAAGVAGWFVQLPDRVNRRPLPHQNLGHRYVFSVGLTITSAGTLRHYGEDPEFDVGG
jgi:hypothetical protein